MPAILRRLSILFINYISPDVDNTKILLYKLFKPACVNAANVQYGTEFGPKILSIFNQNPAQYEPGP